MPARTKSPKEGIKIRRNREVAEGDEIMIKATVVRVGKDTDDNPDKVTIKLRGYSIPVTLSAVSLDLD